MKDYGERSDGATGMDFSQHMEIRKQTTSTMKKKKKKKARKAQ
jgi:hypothetical protein